MPVGVFVGLYALVGIIVTLVGFRYLAQEGGWEDDLGLLGLLFLMCVAIWPLGIVFGVLWLVGVLVALAIKPTKER